MKEGRHSKDRIFTKKTERASDAKSEELRRPFRRILDNRYAFEFTPFEEAVCTEDGSVFNVKHIIPYIREYGQHPVSGASLKQEDLIPLTFHMNSEGEYHCPVLDKVFTEFTRIVAIKTTGNVFSYEAVIKFNLRIQNWKELLTDEPFKREDIIPIQNPKAFGYKALVNFGHVKKNLKVEDEGRMKTVSDPTHNKNVKGDAKKMPKEAKTGKGRQLALHGEVKSRQPAFSIVDAASASLHGRSAAKVKSRYTSVATSRSFISTSYDPLTKNEHPKKKCNVQLHTTHGEVKSRKPPSSIVDVSSPSIHGRRVAAKAASGDRTAARIARHTPVNVKMVKRRDTSGATSSSFTSTSYNPVTKNEIEYVMEKVPVDDNDRPVEEKTTINAFVHGRSAAVAAAEATSSDKLTAPIAMHMSSYTDRTPENAKMIDESNQDKELVIDHITVFLEEIIGRGSNETVVYKGIYRNYIPIAVKRVKKAYLDVCKEEVWIIYAASIFPNIISCFGWEEDNDFVYIAMERGDCDLYELVKNNETYAELFMQNGYPSSDLLKLMWDIVVGLAFLHTLNLIHQDLKPQNVLILKHGGLCPKLSGMRSSSHPLTDESSLRPNATGWRAPEQILHGPQTLAMDMFSLGCVLFFCLTGEHPYGGDLEREINVTNGKIVNLSLVEHNYEAMDLVSRLLEPNPEIRPKTLEVLIHPLFWDSITRTWFLWDASLRIKSKDEKTGYIVAALESKGYGTFLETWDKTLDPEFLSHMTKQKERCRKYRYNKVQDLLYMFQDTIDDYFGLPMNIQGLLGPNQLGVDDYFRQKFPKLLVAVYDVMRQHCYEERWFRHRLEDIPGAEDVFHWFKDLRTQFESNQQVSASNNNGESELETEVVTQSAAELIIDS